MVDIERAEHDFRHSVAANHQSPLVLDQSVDGDCLDRNLYIKFALSRMPYGVAVVPPDDDNREYICMYV